MAKLKGTYVERPKQTRSMKREAQAAIDSLDSKRARKKAAKEASKAQQKQQKQAPEAANNGTAAVYTQPRPYQAATMGEQPPNQILFLTNLPPETTDKMLQMLFTQFVTSREFENIRLQMRSWLFLFVPLYATIVKFQPRLLIT